MKTKIVLFFLLIAFSWNLSAQTETSCAAATGLSVLSKFTNSVKIGYALPAGITKATLEIVKAGTTINDATVWLTKDISIPSTYTERGDLMPGTTYIYRIKTVCANGTVKYTSNGDFITPTASTATCSAATNVSVSNITATGVTVNFKVPTDVASASLEILPANSSTWMSKPITNLSATSIERFELTPSTKYTCKIKTTCANSSVNFSAIADFTTPAAQTTNETCAAATGLSVLSKFTNSVKIGFSLPAGISKATLEIVKAGTTINDATVWQTKDLSIPSTSTERGDLQSGTGYIYRVKTVCNNGTVKYSSLGDFTTLATTSTLPPCSPAINLTVGNITTTTAKFGYTLPQGIVSATLEVIPANSTAWLTRTLTLSSTTYDRNELILATKYYYRIRTVCSNGTVSYTPEAYFITLGNKNGVLTGTASSTETATDLTVTCFPNPATSGITVNILGGSGQLVDLQLSNIYGKLVYQSKFSQNEIQNINVGSYPRGIYVLRVSVAGKTSSLKIVLN